MMTMKMTLLRNNNLKVCCTLALSTSAQRTLNAVVCQSAHEMLTWQLHQENQPLCRNYSLRNKRGSLKCCFSSS